MLGLYKRCGAKSLRFNEINLPQTQRKGFESLVLLEQYLNKKNMLSVTVNDTKAQEISAEQLVNLDILAEGDTKFHLLKNNRSYNIEVVELNAAEKTALLSINGRTYTVQAEDELDQLLKKLGMSGAGSAKVNNIKAPMPGLILQIMVEVGQAIAKGDSLLILEAMKMENVIKSPGAGVVKHIIVSKGMAVEKNQVMIELV